MMGADLYLENLRESYRARREVQRRGRLRVALFLIALALALVVACIVETATAGPKRPAAPVPDVAFDWHGDRVAHETKIGAFLDWYFQHTNGRRLARAREVVPVLLDVCESERVNPALVAAIVTLESTWQADATGKLGEVGLMQINRDGAARDPAENIRTGIAMLRRGWERCGSTFGAVSYYATGRTCSWDGAGRRLRMAARIEEGP